MTSGPEAATEPQPPASPVTRPPLLGQGLVFAALAAGLYALAVLGEWPLLAAVVAMQTLVALALLALLDAPAAGGAFVLAVGAGIASNTAIAVDDGRARALAGVLGMALVAGLLHELARRGRERVVESLAGTLVVITAVTSAACLSSAAQQEEGSGPLRVSLAAAGAALLLSRVGDRFLGRVPVAPGALRTWPGLGLALLGALGTAVLIGQGDMPPGRAALIGLVAVSAVMAVDLGLDLAGAELSPRAYDARRVAALRPTSVLLPFCLLGPIVLVVIRLLPAG